MPADSNLNFLKPELKLAIDHIEAVAGNVLVIRPKGKNQRFTDGYVDWLQENLDEVLPPGVRAMILMEDSTEFSVLHPQIPSNMEEDSVEAEAYASGWRAAFAALEETARS